MNEVSIYDWRAKVVVVPQEIHIFNGSILYNIVLDETFEQKRLENIINKFELFDFIENLPNGLNTLIGEEGINLSGGQKQFIGIIRALYKRSEFYILDEPSSALDKISKRKIINVVKELKKEHLVLLITHQLSDFNYLADEIYIIENRKILARNL